jgi:hypothetical protein
MFSAILYMLKQTLRGRASPLPFPSFFPSYCDVSQARSYFSSTMLMYRLSLASSHFAALDRNILFSTLFSVLPLGCETMFRTQTEQSVQLQYYSWDLFRSFRDEAGDRTTRSWNEAGTPRILFVFWYLAVRKCHATFTNHLLPVLWP